MAGKYFGVVRDMFEDCMAAAKNLNPSLFAMRERLTAEVRQMFADDIVMCRELVEEMLRCASGWVEWQEKSV